ncbi:DCC1-like thiol-disulfide oxidoreductase family protein [Halostella sp. PRR32]|uniref:DCC1-like thiol-disulfide oxidoreductase family protein n=1 Tax=Halostella sp. PRR32 TaxID=3098147 RepID=UPI002B1E1561|nr:DCC1-like thiol-disulfide oxidoreductase family protein [Halostella sp. PRR32]
MEGTGAYDGVLIYDGECPLCSAAATALRRLRTVGSVSWYDDAAQAFLAAQFGETPFALVFVDRETEAVYAGRAAASELCDRAGLPVLVRDIVGENYEAIADGIRSVAGLDGSPDPYHGVYPLADDAAERFDALADAADGTVHVPRTEQ